MDNIKFDNKGEPISTEGYTAHYFTKEEYEELLKIPGVKKPVYHSNDINAIPLTPNADRIYQFYNNNRDLDPKLSNNHRILYEITSKKYPNIKYMEYPGAKIKEINGYEYLILPKETKTYKGLTWFHDTEPAHIKKQIWIGNLAIAVEYALLYFGGVVAYTFKRDVKLFIYNKKNMEKLHAETTEAKCRESLEDLYGINITAKQKLSKISNSYYKWKDVHLFNSIINCTDSAQKLMYGVVTNIKMRKYQNYLNNYVERFGSDGTIFPSTLSCLYHHCLGEEITINPSLLVINKKDPYYWKNWGLDESKINKDGFRIKDQTIYNTNFKINDFYFDQSFEYKKIPNTINLMTYNVHSLISFNDNYSQEHT